MIQRKIAALEAGAGIQTSQGAEAAKQYFLAGAGKSTMEDIRKITDAMADEENSLLRIRNDEAAASVSNAQTTLFAGILAALVILSAAGFIITRNISNPLKEITRHRTDGGRRPHVEHRSRGARR